MNWKQKLFTDSNQIKRSQIVFLTDAPLGNQYMLRNCPRRKPELKCRPGGGQLGYDTISSFLNLNKHCSLRLLYSWKVLASLKAWFKLWLSRFRWNVTVSRRVPEGGGGRGALLFRLNGLPWTGYRSDVCNRSVIPFKTARAFSIKPLAIRMSFLYRMPFESTNINHKGLQRTANEYAEESRIYKDLKSTNDNVDILNSASRIL